MVFCVVLNIHCKKETMIVENADSYSVLRNAFGIIGYSQIRNFKDSISLNARETEANHSVENFDGAEVKIIKTETEITTC